VNFLREQSSFIHADREYAEDVNSRVRHPSVSSRGETFREFIADVPWRFASTVLAPFGFALRCRQCYRGRCTMLFGLHRDGRRGLFWKCRVCGSVRPFR
jgi:hypothetical protein